MHYETYTVEDFVADPYFIHWVKNPSDEAAVFWQAWISQHPEKEDTIKEARQLIELLQFRETHVPEGKFLEIWENIVDVGEKKVLEVNYHKEALPSEGRSKHSIAWYLSAAATLMVGMLTYTLFFYKSKIVIRTAYSESRVLFLPDSTKVTLNANSTLSYDENFNESHREVWLNGEAFFSVVHKKNNQNFLVHTDELKVEVLGTKFNVNSRRGRSAVVLEEGKVKLDIQEQDKTSQVTMQPGEMVEFSKSAKSVARKKVDVTTYSSWRNNLLIFKSASLEEIARNLEDNYGYEVIFQDQELASKRFTGSTSVDNLQELFQKLDRVFDLTIQQEGKKLIFKNK